jgi:hypothetical protein
MSCGRARAYRSGGDALALHAALVMGAKPPFRARQLCRRSLGQRSRAPLGSLRDACRFLALQDAARAHRIPSLAARRLHTGGARTLGRDHRGDRAGLTPKGCERRPRALHEPVCTPVAVMQDIPGLPPWLPAASGPRALLSSLKPCFERGPNLIELAAIADRQEVVPTQTRFVPALVHRVQLVQYSTSRAFRLAERSVNGQARPKRSRVSSTRLLTRRHAGTMQARTAVLLGLPTRSQPTAMARICADEKNAGGLLTSTDSDF